MPGYYYSTPIGQGMSNLARAIGGAQGQAAQQGLMQARQGLVDQQAITEAAQQEMLRQHGNLYRRQAAAVDQSTGGARGLAEAFSMLPNAPLSPELAPYVEAATPPAPEPVAANYGLGAPSLPQAVGGYVPSVR